MSVSWSNEKNRNRRNKIVCWILAIISVAAIGMNFEIAAETDGGGVLYKILLSFRGWGIGQFLLVICIGCIFSHIFGVHPLQKDIAAFSWFLSLLMVTGLCYRNATGIVLAIFNMAQIVKTCIVMMGYGALFYCAILFLERWLRRVASENKNDRLENGRFYKTKVGSFLLLCWLPYLIAFYPGTTLYDAGTMLEQFYGYRELTNHHPYFQILLLGNFVKAGDYFGSGAAGMFVYVLIQAGAFIAVLSYMMGLLKDLGVGKKIRRALVFIYAFLPVFPLYAISVGKNINFAIVILLLTIFMFEIVRDAEAFCQNRKKMALLPVMLILICLFRNEGLAIVLGCFPCFILMSRKYWRGFAVIFTGVLIFAGIWFKGILPAAGVADGSIAESLSIPFMQTARSVCYYGDDMAEDEKAAIDKILVFDTLAERYNPETSDYVKNLYNENVTDEEVKAYLKVYWRQFLAHPVTYIDAFLNKCYGYFYPDDKGKIKAWYVVGADVPTLNEDGFDLKSKFPSLVKGMDRLMEVFREIPMLGYTTSIGFYTWCAFLAMFFIAKGRKRRLLYIFVPSVLVLLVCVASPVNAYFRYGLPIVFSIPFFAAVVIWNIASWDRAEHMSSKKMQLGESNYD